MSSKTKESSGDDVDVTTTSATELGGSDSQAIVEADTRDPEPGDPDPGEAEAVDGDTDEVTDSDVPTATGPIKSALAWAGRRWGTLLVAVLLVVSAAGAGSVYWWMYRPDQQTTAVAQQQVLDAAKQGTTALLSYAPETLDKDLANAKSRLTGEFLKYYSDFTDQIVAPAARQKGVKTEATIVRAAVSEMHPDRAVVLVFVNQVTTSKDRPEPALATSSVMVTLTKKQGNWLISEFKPV